MSGPYSPSPPAASTNGAERMATVITAAIGAVAVIGAVLVGVLTSDDVSAASAQPPGVSVPGTGSDPGVSGSGSSDEGGSSTTAVPGSSGTSGSSGSGGSDLDTDFPVPSGAEAVTSYGSLPKPSSQKWYVSTSSLASVYSFYTTTFKVRGGTTYTSPTVVKNSSGAAIGYVTIYHFDDGTTVTLSIQSNYLNIKPGTVLIQAMVLS